MGMGIRTNSSDRCILAEEAVQIAAKATGRKDQVTGMKAARRFFLDGIQSQRGELAVVQRYDGIAPVGTNPTKTGLSFAKNTAMKTKSAFCAHVCRTTWKRWMV